jgi:single-stranded-DNA-specific exonuclease
MSVPAFLSVAQSAAGKRWELRAVNDRHVAMLAQGYGLPEVAARALSARGVTPDEVEVFLDPKLRALLPDPSRFKDMDKAARRIARAIRDGENVAVFGDYDVDGAASAAVLIRFFRMLGRPLRLYVPDRLKEGYGPNPAAMRLLAEEGVRLAVTVDCGITSFVALAAAAEAGMETIIIDHHAAEPQLPAAVAVVNPNRLDEDRAYGHICAAAVAYLTVIAVNRVLRDSGYYQNRPQPDLMGLLDIVGLATVCDVMPLTGLNRALVAQGLKVMAKRGNAGLAALADVAGVKETPDAYHFGYILGPRVNAGGRVGASDLGARLLSCDDGLEALELARRLNDHNGERQEIEHTVLEEALAQLTAAGGDPADNAALVTASEGWHPGVVGIVAGRMKERFNRPACAIAIERTGEGALIGKGSGRSVKGFDLGGAVIAARQEGLLLGGGGHPMAAGFSIAPERIDDFRRFLSRRFAAAGEAEQSGVDLTPRLELDGALSIHGATMGLVDALAKLAPFGNGNPEPRFALTDVRVARADVVGKNHVRCILTSGGGGRLKAMAFRALDEDLGQLLLNSGGMPLHVAGTLRPDRWQGREDAQMFIEDAARAGS